MRVSCANATRPRSPPDRSPTRYEDVVTTKEKATEKSTCFRFFDGGADAPHLVENGIAHHQAFVGLGVVVDFDVTTETRMATQGR